MSLAAVTIALHFVRATGERVSPEALLEAGDTIFDSFERDLVSYAYRDRPPFRSTPLDRATDTTVVFPAEVEVRSEGRVFTLVAADQDKKGPGRRRRLRAVRSRTVFTDGIVVDHLALTNMGPAGSTYDDLNEYDVVKLVKLARGGEVTDVDRTLRFSTPDGDVDFDFSGWLTTLGDEPPLNAEHLRATTVLIATGDDDAWSPVYCNVCRLPEAADDVAGEFRTMLAAEVDGAARQLRATEGIVCSMLDVAQRDHLELADALEPAIGSPEFLLWLQKANLVCLTKSDRVTTVEGCRRDIGASPYLLAPHAVLLHNQEVLRLVGVVLAPDRKGLEKLSRKQLANDRSDVVQMLRQDLLPNVFHYRTERTLFDAGVRGRGLRDRAADLERGLAQLEGEIVARVQRAQVHEERVLAVIFGLLSATAIGDLLVLAFSDDTPRWHAGAHLWSLAAVFVVVWLVLRIVGRR